MCSGNASIQVNFERGKTDQVVPVNFPIIDNNIALEGDKMRTFTIASVSPSSVFIGDPNRTVARIRDDDGELRQ